MLFRSAECKHVPFHALRHTFATQALRYGMDVKTLASTIGHESVETTLNVYSHTTDEGMRTAANRIDRAMGAISGVTSENNGTQGAVEKYPTQDRKSPHARNLSLVGASTDGREQARSIRSVKTCGKEDTRQSSTDNASPETSTLEASKSAKKSLCR